MNMKYGPNIEEIEIDVVNWLAPKKGASGSE